MSAIKRYKVLYDATAAGTGNWVRLDNRYEVPEDRVVQAALTAGDTLIVQATSKDQKGLMDETAFLAALTAKDITVLNTFAASGNYEIDGPWSYVRVVKTGAAGNGKVQGFI